jgi:putative spermidine/putrescine transport system permease protein
MGGRNPGSEGGGVSPALALLVPGLVVVMLLQFLPLATLFRYSFNEFSPTVLMVEAFTLENYGRFFADSYYQEVLWTTLGIAGACTVSSLVLGYPVAWFLVRTSRRVKAIALVLILFPLLIGNVVRAAGWMAVFGRGGIINHYLVELGITSEPVEVMYTPFAVYVGLLGVMLPFMILTLHSVLDGLDLNLLSAAENLGARPMTSFFRITLPLSMSGVAAGSVLVFMLSMNAYATPVLLGGSSFRMMAPELYKQISVASNWPFGAALAFILVVVTFLVTTTATLVLARQPWRA